MRVWDTKSFCRARVSVQLPGFLERDRNRRGRPEWRRERWPHHWHARHFSFTPDNQGVYVAHVVVTDKDNDAPEFHTFDINVVNADPIATIGDVV